MKFFVKSRARARICGPRHDTHWSSAGASKTRRDAVGNGADVVITANAQITAPVHASVASAKRAGIIEIFVSLVMHHHPGSNQAHRLSAQHSKKLQFNLKFPHQQKVPE